MADHNPYANDAGGFDELDGPQRTSALAVVSLVMSLLCCIPGLGLIGSALGVVSLIGISGSRGRVGGKGMAMAGIIIGVLMTVAWISFTVMGLKFADQLTEGIYGATGKFMTKVEMRDFDGARGEVVGPVITATDEQMEAFRVAYEAEYGAFINIPTDFFGEVIPAYAQLGQVMQNYQGRNDVIPIPANFDSGGVLLLAQVDQSQQASPPQGPAGGFQIPMSDIWILMPDGTELKLIGGTPQSAVPALPSGATDADSDDTADDDGP